MLNLPGLAVNADSHGPQEHFSSRGRKLARS